MFSVRNVVVGVSGGVDSTVAALLLKKKGYNVIGVFMKNWDLNDEHGTCSAVEDLEDSKYVCQKLKIPFYEVNFIKEYWNEVFVNFTSDYEKGLTPNPDIMCNKHIKFKTFIKYAMESLKADFIATGHYARTSMGDFLENYQPSENVKLLKAKDHLKDQTFFLSQVSQEALKKTMFPLGSLKKNVVKKIATENGFEKIANKPESTGICFIGNRRFQEFMAEYVSPKKGNFVNISNGKIEGTHDGIHLWTLGQRSRLGGFKKPMFVARKFYKSSDILVAPGTHHSSLFSRIFVTEKPHWIADPLDLMYKEEVDFRFQHVRKLVKCDLFEFKSGQLLGVLKRPLRAVTPGQFAVFYKDDECLGSAKIIEIGPSEYILGNSIPEDYIEYEEEEQCANNNQ